MPTREKEPQVKPSPFIEKGHRIIFAEAHDAANPQVAQECQGISGYPPSIKDPLEQQAAGKRLCGLCGHKAARKGDWSCTRKIPKPFLEEYDNLIYYPCPAPAGDCIGFEPCPRVKKSVQIKPERLAVPPGMIFLYIDRVTVAVLLRGGDVALGSIHMGFAFCHSGNPKKGLKPDRFCKATGRNEAMKQLYDDPLIAPYLYEPIRIAKEVTRAVLDHDLSRVSRYAALLPLMLYKRVPGWTRAIAKRIERWERVVRMVRPRGGHKKLDLMPHRSPFKPSPCLYTSWAAS
jgi:hypothetical protein